MCNAAYMHLRQELQAALVMVEPKGRARAIREWEDELNAPMGGWEQLDKRLHEALAAG